MHVTTGFEDEVGALAGLASDHTDGVLERLVAHPNQGSCLPDRQDGLGVRAHLIEAFCKML